jgi:hypothetical protein
MVCVGAVTPPQGGRHVEPFIAYEKGSKVEYNKREAGESYKSLPQTIQNHASHIFECRLLGCPYSKEKVIISVAVVEDKKRDGRNSWQCEDIYCSAHMPDSTMPIRFGIVSVSIAHYVFPYLHMRQHPSRSLVILTSIKLLETIQN